MGKLIYLLNLSLDGYIETTNRTLDWSNVDEEIHSWFNDQERSFDASFYGRRMWEIMSPYWPTAENDPKGNAVTREYARIWKAQPKIVFSNTLTAVSGNGRLVRGDVGEVLAKTRQEFKGDLAVSGPNLAAQFIQRGLVDEFRLVIHPVVLGGGTPYWPALTERIKLRLNETKRFSSGVMYLGYSVIR